MMKKMQFLVNQPTQPVPIVAVKKETRQERFARLKRIADATGWRFIHVYLADEKRQQSYQR